MYVKNKIKKKKKGKEWSVIFWRPLILSITRDTFFFQARTSSLWHHVTSLNIILCRGEHFCHYVKRSLLGKKKKRGREIGTANRRVFYGSVGRLAKGLLSASDRWGLGSLILRSIKIDPSLPPWNSLSPFAKEERRRPISSFSPIPVTSRSNNTVPLGLSFLLNNL